MRYYFEAMQQQHHALPSGEGVLNKVLYREALLRGPIPYPLKYRKIPKISPLFEGLIFGGAYIGKGLCTEGNLRYKISWASL